MGGEWLEQVWQLAALLICGADYRLSGLDVGWASRLDLGLRAHRPLTRDRLYGRSMCGPGHSRSDRGSPGRPESLSRDVQRTPLWSSASRCLRCISVVWPSPSLASHPDQQHAELQWGDQRGQPGRGAARLGTGTGHLSRASFPGSLPRGPMAPLRRRSTERNSAMGQEMPVVGSASHTCGAAHHRLRAGVGQLDRRMRRDRGRCGDRTTQARARCIGGVLDRRRARPGAGHRDSGGHSGRHRALGRYHHTDHPVSDCHLVSRA